MRKITMIFILMLAVVGMTQAQVIEDFEHIQLNVMLGGEADNSSMRVVPNPDPEGNTSSHVVQFMRSQHGVPWGGFWSILPEPLDLTEYKYVYVDVWKPRISPVRFKVEGGETADLEIESMYPQTKTEEWETLVFDFSEKDGHWNVIAFMPDFEDPLTLEEDIVIYFDNIRVGGPPENDENGDAFAEVDFVWCDFEIEGFTNVDGFREVVNINTVATDIAEAGADGGTAIELDYIVEEEWPVTGYRMWAYVEEGEQYDDLSDYTHFVIRAKAEEEITGVVITLLDTEAVGGSETNGMSWTHIDVGTEWQEIVIPLDEFHLPEGYEQHPDMTALQKINILFIYDDTDPDEGVLMVDMVGFNEGVPGEDGYMVEDFEHIMLNWFAAGANAYMHVVPNPDLEGNTSTHVVEFLRGHDGDPWAGFWSVMPDPVDLTENKYFYVDVWKPRISPIVFKLEGGEGPDVELSSMEPQTKVGEWETMVFDFSEVGGLWNVIVFFPDFEDPLTLEEDIIIYFDNIRLGGPPDDDPEGFEVTFNVDMGPAEGFDPDEHSVFVTGNFAGWAEPGTEGSYEMTRVSKGKDAVEVFYETFGDGLPGDWENVVISGPDDFPGWEYTTEGGMGPDGEELNSTTANDGYMIVDSDFWGEVGAPEEADLITSSINLSNAVSDVIFSVEHYALTYGYAEIYIYISVDDFETETLLYEWKDAPALEYNSEENPLLTEVDITDIAAGESNVKVKFKWIGEWDFWWMIDDVKIMAVMGEAPEDMIYTVTVPGIEAGEIQYKYFSDAFGAGWEGGEWDGDPNRTADITGDTVINDKWGDLVTSIVDAEVTESLLSLFPNPATSVITVESSSVIKEVRVFDITGRMVMQRKVDASSAVMDISTLRTGMYIMQVQTSEGVEGRRFHVAR